jgi:tRNA-Thr(GGU) m(6)t(6)A37 methyltransferase TsaA
VVKKVFPLKTVEPKFGECWMSSTLYTIEPIAFVRSTLTRLEDAPMQGDEGAPEAWLEFTPQAIQGLMGIQPGDKLILLTWLHLAERDVLQVHPRGDLNRPLTGVFTTRSPDRPNPIGLHRVAVLEVTEQKLRVAPLEAIDGTPILDIKPVLSGDPSDR